uniref:E3 ubiquitin-protein ligase listerin n=1 Tax=Anisakis simplex TaxID=6269 RepID=A0A0M3JBN2_ANISI
LQIGSLTLANTIANDDDDDLTGVENGTCRAADILLKYAFWLNITAKLTAKTNLSDRLRQWFPESASKISESIGSSAKVVDIEMHHFDSLFEAVYMNINEDCSLKNDLAKFVNKFKPTSASKKYAD